MWATGIITSWLYENQMQMSQQTQCVLRREYWLGDTGCALSRGFITQVHRSSICACHTLMQWWILYQAHHTRAWLLKIFGNVPLHIFVLETSFFEWVLVLYLYFIVRSDWDWYYSQCPDYIFFCVLPSPPTLHFAIKT